MGNSRRFVILVGALGLTLSHVASAQTAGTSAGHCESLPRVIHQVEPGPSHYPQKDSAVVVLDILVSEKGKPLDPKVVTSSGIKEFDSDAMSTVKKWRFTAAVCNGKSAPVHIAVEIKSNVVH